MPFSTGMTRAISSSAEMLVDPGRVDSPPTSRMSAPALRHFECVPDRRAHIEELFPVTETIGRDVQHAHDQRALAENQRARGESPPESAANHRVSVNQLGLALRKNAAAEKRLIPCRNVVGGPAIQMRTLVRGGIAESNREGVPSGPGRCAIRIEPKQILRAEACRDSPVGIP